MTKDEFCWFLERYDFDTRAGAATMRKSCHQRYKPGSPATGLRVTKRSVTGKAYKDAYSQFLSGSAMGKTTDTLLIVPSNEIVGYREKWLFKNRNLKIYSDTDPTESLDSAESFMKSYLEDYKLALGTTEEQIQIIHARVTDILRGEYDSWGLDIFPETEQKDGYIAHTNINTIRLSDHEDSELEFGPRVYKHDGFKESLWIMDTQHLIHDLSAVWPNPIITYGYHVLSPFAGRYVVLKNVLEPSLVSSKSEITNYVIGFSSLVKNYLNAHRAEIAMELDFVDKLLGRIAKSKNDRGSI